MSIKKSLQNCKSNFVLSNRLKKFDLLVINRHRRPSSSSSSSPFFLGTSQKKRSLCFVESWTNCQYDDRLILFLLFSSRTSNRKISEQKIFVLLLIFGIFEYHRHATIFRLNFRRFFCLSASDRSILLFEMRRISRYSTDNPSFTIDYNVTSSSCSIRKIRLQS